jgi:hypothetical protein
MDEVVASIIEVITSDVERGQAHVEFPEKEKQLRRIIQSLTPVDALALRKRLQADRDDDALVVAFRRLTRDRRDRLIAFLADPARSVRPID